MYGYEYVLWRDSLKYRVCSQEQHTIKKTTKCKLQTRHKDTGRESELRESQEIPDMIMIILQ